MMGLWDTATPSASDDASSTRAAKDRAPAARRISLSAALRDVEHGGPGRTYPAAACRAILRPRPYEEIYAEQAYLSTSLQEYDARSHDLIRRYSAAERDLQAVEQTWCKQRRRLRKQLNLLRLQISEAAKQQRALFVRLSELHVEASSRASWAWARRQTPRTRVGGAAASARALSGASPEFVPKAGREGEREADDGAPEMWPCASTDCGPDSAKRGSETVCEDDDDDFASSGGGPSYVLLGSVQDDGALAQKHRPESEPPDAACGERRLSLPNMASVWPN